MISIGETSLIIVIETIILLLASTIILFYLWRKNYRKYIVCMNDKNSQSHSTPQATVEHYLTTEIKLTTARFESLFTPDDHGSVEVSESDILILRKKYLEMESELLSSADRDDNFWSRFVKQLQGLLDELQLVKRMKLTAATEDAEEELFQLKKIMELQNTELEYILANIDDNELKLEIKDLKEKLVALSRSHKELSFCIITLEDENQFLRNQISGLLKL